MNTVMPAQSSAFEYGLEPAPDHALPVEGHVELLHGRVLHHLLPGHIGRGLVRPHDPGEHHLLAFLQLHGALEVRGLAVLDVVTSGFDLLQRAWLDAELAALSGRDDARAAITAARALLDRAPDPVTARLLGEYLDALERPLRHAAAASPADVKDA